MHYTIGTGLNYKKTLAYYYTTYYMIVVVLYL